MSTSVEMVELRKIRDANSLRYLSQTPEEREVESKKTMEWFVKAIGKPIQVVNNKN
jgi:hypothetical protein